MLNQKLSATSASGEKVEDIVAGIHEAIASRIAAMARRVKIEPDIVLTGGVAKNRAMKKALEKEFGMEIKTPPEPQIVGAVGLPCLHNHFLLVVFYIDLTETAKDWLIF